MKIKNYTGFTIIELIVVILLVGIISIFMLPRFFASNVFAERRTVDELISALRYTQQLSMNRGENHRLQINPNNYIYQRSNGGTWSAIRNPDGGTNNNFSNNITLSAATITFNQLGQPIPNTAPAQTITVGSQLITIEVDTGYAH